MTLAIKDNPEATMRKVRFGFGDEPKILGLFDKSGFKEGLPFAGILPAIDRLNNEHRTNVRLVSAVVADHALNDGTETWKALRHSSPFLVDAAIGYERPGAGFGTEIVFHTEGKPRVLLATGRYMGEKNAALAVLGLSASDWKQDGEDIRLDVPENRLVLVENFPPESGWYKPKGETTVPQGDRAKCSSDTRYLRRINAPYVGFLGRDIYVVTSGRLWDGASAVGRGQVRADLQMSSRLGLAVEIPEADVAKF